ncbi:bifunctional 2-polyprenyl-6-hydroxyphenol methylase/3-demethylubiquinol 3-O-methyltransferase UbiG [Flavobacterium sp. HJ-32-4]|uniref:class I SAM-dependent methyltransferase n=2 Tax=unclassified Flavobacterium TaxID=196869 RepID=UPI001F13D3C2|nr:class I SAM-dependent methyltransferase [Flavobacterium sp. HJ-32-4]UMY65711.1 class I SAM-dependent methyltransferase [Flavobacterium sp. HJ-32-4]
MKSAADILETNKRQRDFYNEVRQNFLTRCWASVRNGLLQRIRKNTGISSQVYELHTQWLGDLSDKKVLDLGCFAGNYLSKYMAERAKSYLGIDLSDVAIEKLRLRLADLPNARVEAIDFLSPDFTEDGFDIIYAYGVLHHFENTELIIAHLQKRLAPGGEIISYDPMQTSWPVKLLRTLYRPFQSDADWEWPFNKKTVRAYETAFLVQERRGLLGKSKWLALLNLLPFSNALVHKLGTRWHQQDWERSSVSDAALFRCMHITMRLQKR